MQTPEQPVPEELSPDDLVLLIDGLLRSGTQHLHLAVGEKTSVQTVNSTECCENGACMIPTLGNDDEDEPIGRNHNG